MRLPFRQQLIKMHNRARRDNDQKILSLLDNKAGTKLLDLGCDDGEWTLKLAEQAGAVEVYGVEVVPVRAEQARQKGIDVKESDLNRQLPFADCYFDIVHANQVIEHLHDTDTFISEIRRILKPSGQAIISTENLSSWHNIFALILGFQPFSMTNFSSKGNIGNPFALWQEQTNEKSAFSAWQHNRLFSYFGLKDLFEKSGLKVEAIKTSGYYPLFRNLSRIDPIHGHYIVYSLRK